MHSIEHFHRIPIRVAQRAKSVIAGALLAAAFTAPASAAVAVTVLPKPDLHLSNQGNVHAIVRQTDGKLVIGGNFSMVGRARRSHLARFNADGTLDTAWAPQANIAVRALALDAAGNLYVGGFFSSIDGVARNSVARLSPAGVVDPVWNPSANGEVLDLLVDGTQVYLAGAFSNIGGTARSRLARVSTTGAGAADATWNPAPNLAVETLVKVGDALYAGGLFTQVGTETRSRLVKLSTLGVGAVDTTFVANANDQVSALLIDSQGALIVGGRFTQVNSTGRTRIARVNATTGVLDSAWNPGANERVFGLALDSSNNVVVGGSFTTFGGQPRNRLARMTAAGVFDASYDPNVRNTLFGQLFLLLVEAILPNADGSVIIGGRFDSIGAAARPQFSFAHIGAGGLEPNGPAAPQVLLPVSRLGVGAAVLEMLDRKFMVGGSFEVVSEGEGPPRASANLLRLNADLSLDTAYSGAVNGAINRLERDASTNRLYAAGSFSQVAGQNRNGLVRFNADYSLDTAWTPQLSAFATVNALEFDSAGNRMLVGGVFSTVNGLPRMNIAAIPVTGNGAPDGFNPGAQNSVTDILRTIADIRIAFVGNQIGGALRSFVAALDAFGVVLPFNPNPDDVVRAVALGPLGDIFLGGCFRNVGGVPMNSLALVNPDTGAPDPGFVSGLGPMGCVEDLVPIDIDPSLSNELVAVGRFETANGTPVLAGYVTALQAEVLPIVRAEQSGALGLILFAFGYIPTTSVSLSPFVQPTASLLAGGNFVDINGVSRIGLVALRIQPDSIFANGFE